MIPQETLVQITAPGNRKQSGFCAGAIVDASGHVYEAAPIVKYMAEERWILTDIVRYCRTRAWVFRVVQPQNMKETS